MTLTDCKQAYEELSAIASQQCRYLALAGIAIVWIYRTGSNGDFVVREELHWPTILFCSSLAADLLQYIVGTCAWFIYFRYRERLVERGKAQRDEAFLAPVWMPSLTWLLWFTKLALVGIGYFAVLRFLSGELRS